VEQFELASEGQQITGVDVFRAGSPFAEQEEMRRLALEAGRFLFVPLKIATVESRKTHTARKIHANLLQTARLVFSKRDQDDAT
jgi:hypothetical protein